jgi:hypothetical protein
MISRIKTGLGICAGVYLGMMAAIGIGQTVSRPGKAFSAIKEDFIESTRANVPPPLPEGYSYYVSSSRKAHLFFHEYPQGAFVEGVKLIVPGTTPVFHEIGTMTLLERAPTENISPDKRLTRVEAMVLNVKNIKAVFNSPEARKILERNPAGFMHEEFLPIITAPRK